MKRPDVGIGYRAAAEVKRLFPKKKHALIAIGCGTMFPEEGYSFCFSDGSVPDLTKLDDEYLNIGGTHG